VQIRSFAHKGLKKLYAEDNAKGVPPDTAGKLRKMLAFLDDMQDPEELRSLSTWKAHMLTGDRKGIWSLSVTRNRRLMFRIGIDVGGTFTDLLAIDAATGAVKLAKVATTPDNQAIGFMAALAAAGVESATLQAVVHGTTTTTNALLERKIAKVGLITTKGFRDVLELGRRTRPQPYGLRGTFRPLIEREYRLEVPERMDADGKVLAPLDEAAVAEAAKTLLALDCEAVVIHFLHSYINPAHERRGLTAELRSPDGSLRR